MAMVMDCEESIANLYEAYRKFVQGKKGIVYAIDRDHARHITEYYQRQKVNCCWIEAKTPAAERDRLVQQYRDGLIDVVVNMDILSEGADFPEVEFIQLARSYRMGCMTSPRTAEYSIRRCSNTSEGQTTAILPIAPIRIWSIRTGLQTAQDFSIRVSTFLPQDGVERPAQRDHHGYDGKPGRTTLERAQ